MAEIRKTRQIRMLDSEWKDFKELLGTEWLRARIRGARIAETRRKNAEKREAEITK